MEFLNLLNKRKNMIVSKNNNNTLTYDTEE